MRERSGTAFFPRAHARDPRGRRTSEIAPAASGTETDRRRSRYSRDPSASPALRRGRGSPSAAAAAGRRRTCCIPPRAASDSAFERLQVALNFGDSAIGSQRPVQRIRNHISGSHSSRAYGTGRSSISTSGVVSSDQLEQIAQARHVAGKNRARCRSSIVLPDLAILGRGARQRQRPSVVGSLERRKLDRDRERQRRRAEQHLAELGVERRDSSSVGCSGRSTYGQNRSIGPIVWHRDSEGSALDDIKMEV